MSIVSATWSTAAGLLQYRLNKCLLNRTEFILAKDGLRANIHIQIIRTAYKQRKGTQLH